MVIPCLSHFQGSCNEHFFLKKTSFICIRKYFVQLCHRIEHATESCQFTWESVLLV